MTKGGKLKAKQVKDFLDASYKKTAPNQLDGYILDKDLSTDTAKVYYNPTTNKAVVAHRGTKGLMDWGNNLAYAIGAYERTNRFKKGKAVQDKAEAKYGKQNISTLGHSQGAILARKLGKDTKEIINVNPAYGFEKPSANEYNIRSGSDVVSGLYAPVAKTREILYPRFSKHHDITIKSENPKDVVGEHSYNILDRLGEREIGEGGSLNSSSNIYMRRVGGRRSQDIDWTGGAIDGYNLDEAHTAMTGEKPQFSTFDPSILQRPPNALFNLGQSTKRPQTNLFAGRRNPTANVAQQLNDLVNQNHHIHMLLSDDNPNFAEIEQLLNNMVELYNHLEGHIPQHLLFLYNHIGTLLNNNLDLFQNLQPAGGAVKKGGANGSDDEEGTSDSEKDTSENESETDLTNLASHLASNDLMIWSNEELREEIDTINEMVENIEISLGFLDAGPTLQDEIKELRIIRDYLAKIENQVHINGDDEELRKFCMNLLGRLDIAIDEAEDIQLAEPEPPVKKPRGSGRKKGGIRSAEEIQQAHQAHQANQQQQIQQQQQQAHQQLQQNLNALLEHLNQPEPQPKRQRKGNGRKLDLTEEEKKERKSKRNREAYLRRKQNPEEYEKILENSRAYQQKPETKERVKEAYLKRKQNPEEYEKILEQNRAYKAKVKDDPAYKQKKNEDNAKRTASIKADPEKLRIEREKERERSKRYNEKMKDDPAFKQKKNEDNAKRTALIKADPEKLRIRREKDRERKRIKRQKIKEQKSKKKESSSEEELDPLDIYNEDFDNDDFDDFNFEPPEPDNQPLLANGRKKACWKGYEQYGMKTKKGKQVPNCIPIKKGGKIPKKSKSHIELETNPIPPPTPRPLPQPSLNDLIPTFTTRPRINPILNFQEGYGRQKAKQIDFEDVKWGTFKNLFQRYNKAHPNKPLKDLHELANLIIKHPQDFSKVAHKKALFYKNIIEK